MEKVVRLRGFRASDVWPIARGRAPRGSRTYEATCAAHVRAWRRVRKRISHHAGGWKHMLDFGSWQRRVRRTWQTGLRAWGVARHHEAHAGGGKISPSRGSITKRHSPCQPDG